MSRINDMNRYVKSARKHLAPGYDLTTGDMYALYDMSHTKDDLILNAFLVGYEKGCIATSKGYVKP